MKKALSLVLAVLMLAALAACGSQPAAEEKPAEAAAPAAEAPAEEAAPAAEAAEVSDANPVVNLNGEFKAPSGSVLLTSVGQSADSATMATLLKKSGVEFVENATATSADLEGVSVVFVAAGASTKGLGNAGITIEDETARAKELLEACASKSIPVVCCHIGGSARRGGTSDQFIEQVMAQSAYMIVVADGNNDGLFTDYCAKNNVPLTLVKSMANVLTPLGEIFG